MNLKKDAIQFDEKIHRWEHNLALAGEKIIHEETFWIAVGIAFIIALLMVAMLMGPQSVPSREIFPTPFGPMY